MAEWLREEDETPFVCSRGVDKNKIEMIKNNRVFFMESGRGETLEDEEKFYALSGISAAMLEEGDRDLLPPYREASEEDQNLMRDFAEAQHYYFSLLKDEPFIYPEQIASVHRILMKSDENVPAGEKGRFRDAYSKMIQMSYFEPTKGKDVLKQVNYALFDYNCEKKTTEQMFENIAKLHAQLVRIQPFMDGNKRMAFLVTNAILKLNNLSPIVLCKTEEEQKAYSSALKKAILGRDVSDLVDIFVDKELAAQQDRLDVETVSDLKNEINIDAMRI